MEQTETSGLTNGSEIIATLSLPILNQIYFTHIA